MQRFILFTMPSSCAETSLWRNASTNDTLMYTGQRGTRMGRPKEGPADNGRVTVLYGPPVQRSTQPNSIRLWRSRATMRWVAQISNAHRLRKRGVFGARDAGNRDNAYEAFSRLDNELIEASGFADRICCSSFSSSIGMRQAVFWRLEAMREQIAPEQPRRVLVRYCSCSRWWAPSA